MAYHFVDLAARLLIYIGLGGNRRGALRTYMNLMITMLLGGFWHGASWTFVVWGALHGTYLCVERLFRPREVAPDLHEPEAGVIPVMVQKNSLLPAFMHNKKVNMFFAALLTFFLVNVTWVFFRADNFSTAWRLLGSMFNVHDGTAILPTIDMIKVSVVTVLLVATHWMMRNTGVIQVVQKSRWWVVGIVWAFLALSLMLSQKSSDSFIYFQF